MPAPSAKKEDDSAKRTSVPWRHCMKYEQGELIEYVQRLLTNSFFSHDSISFADHDSVVAPSRVAPDVVDTIVLEGHASLAREEAYLKLLQKIRETANDAILRVKFGACTGDILPCIPLQPLEKTVSFTAKRAWQRAMWAMRCGILRKVGEARTLMSQSSAGDCYGNNHDLAPSLSAAPSVSFGVAAASPAATAKYPLSLYHEAVTRQSIDMSRFAASHPCVFVFWCSWEPGCVKYLEENLFSPNLIATSPQQQRNERRDPWLTFCRKFAPVTLDDSGGADSSTGNFQDGIGGKRTRFAGFTAFGGGPDTFEETVLVGSPRGGDGATSGSAGKGGRITTSSLPSAAPPSSGASPSKRRGGKKQAFSWKKDARSLLASKTTKSRSSLKKPPWKASIVLINVDSDPEAAKQTMSVLRGMNAHWSSPHVALHSTWAGEDGLHSELCMRFDVPSLPFVFSAVPAERSCDQTPQEEGEENGSQQQQQEEKQMMSLKPKVPVLHRIQEVNTYVQKRKTKCSVDLLGAGLENGLRTLTFEDEREEDKKAWHEIPKSEREKIIEDILKVLQAVDAPVVFECEVRTVYDTLQSPPGGVSLEGRVEGGIRSSRVLISGCASEKVVRLLQEHTRFLSKNIRNFTEDILIMQMSEPITVHVNPRTPQHRVMNWYDDVSCVHCGVRIFTRESPHFHCLHCPAFQESVCLDCLLGGKHPSTHLLAKIHPKMPTTIETLWGSSNVAPLPTMMGGKLIASAHGYHVGIYCDICHQAIRGVRWKCLMCHDADLCTTCERSWFENSCTRGYDRRHPTEHVFVRVPLAVPGDSSAFFIPTMLNS